MAISTTVSVTVDETGNGMCAGPLSVGTSTNNNSPATYTVSQLQIGNVAQLLPLGFAVNYLFIDANTATGGTQLTLKGNSGDVGVSISSQLPSLIPVSNVTITGYNPAGSGGAPITTNVSQIWLQSTAATLLGIGWY